MARLTPATFRFLQELSKHNNRDWFQKKKELYEDAKTEFEGFLEILLKDLAAFDPSVAGLTTKDCMFRIYRDVRFSKDKSPYKTHLGAYISGIGKKTEVHARAGYYIHIEPGASMLAGGAYVPDTNWLKAIRQEIAYNTDEFKKILNRKAHRELFGGLEGETLSRPPKGYDADHPAIDLLRHKSFLAVHQLSDKKVMAPTFQKDAARIFKTMHPFLTFLNRALD